jgi:ATP-dependent Lhr-like helicase
MSFEPLHPRIRELSDKRFGKATPVQEKAFPVMLSGSHSLVIAPTGIGKTESALLPVLSMFLRERERRHTHGISILYITPLRALNRDMLERVDWWANHLSIRVSVRHGDTSTYERSKQTRSPPEMLITTPETLNSILAAPKMGQHLKGVRWVIIDEIHELVEDKRGVQLSLALERLVERAGEFQRIGLSATVGDPGVTAQFLAGTSRKAEVVDVPLPRPLDLVVESPSAGIEDNALSKTLHMKPSIIAKLRRLHQLVDQHKSVLAFVNTRSMAEMLSSRYAAFDTRHKARVHHSSLSKEVRVVAEEAFKKGDARALIATSSLELGIDIGSIDLVVQYMSPRQVQRIVQRVGRSGHSIEKQPKGVIIAQDAEDILEAGVIAKRALEKKLEGVKVHDKALDVLAHQLIGLSMDMDRVAFDKALAIVRRAYPYRGLGADELFEVLRQLGEERFVFLDANSYRKTRSAFLYYFFNLSMIPDEQKVFVKNSVTRQNVAILDEAFAVEHLTPGAVFISKGQPWTVLDMGEREVVVEPATDISAAIPDWEGEEIPVPFEVAQEVGRYRTNPGKLSELPFDATARKKVADHVAKQEKLGWVPGDREVFIEDLETFCIVHTHFGTLVNETLGKTLSSLMTSFTGAAVSTRADPYRIVFDFPGRSRPDLIEQYLKTLDPDNIRQILAASMERSQLFRWKFIHVAKRFGLLEKGADYQRIGIRRLISAVLNSPIAKETMNELFVEKLDLEMTKEVLRRIQKKEIKLKTVSSAKVSEFGSYTRRASDLFLPERAEAEILDIVKARILQKNVGFECLNCSNVFYRKIEDLPAEVKCPKCGGSMVTVSGSKERDRVASLINAYGRPAVIALQAYGVGPEFASRILKRLHKKEEDLFKDLVEAERTFARTKRYWG